MILLLVAITIFVLKSLDLLYLFQTKEYRLDRILNLFKEEGVLNILYLRSVRMPALSLRNVLIAQGILFNVLPLYLLFRNSNSTYLFIFLIFAPLIALFAMLLGMLLSEIPVRLYRKFIIYKAKEKVKNSKAIFIGITGSYGKTSTKEFLYQILSQKYKVAKTEKNYNSDVGVALSVLRNLKPDTQFFIAELGAYRIGEIKAICRFIKPKFAIMTGIGNQHLSLFGSKKNLLESKAELLESLPEKGIVYINKDIKDWQFFAKKTKAKKIFYTLHDLPFEIKTNLVGEHVIQNLLPCIALAQQLRVEKGRILKTIKNLKPIQGRLSKAAGIKQSTILDDSYNSNVEGFIMAIKTAKRADFRQKLILSRGLIELGAEKASSYQKIISELTLSDLVLLTTDKLFKSFDRKNKVLSFQNESKLLDYIKEKADKNTLIVIEGRFEPKIIETLIYDKH